MFDMTSSKACPAANGGGFRNTDPAQAALRLTLSALSDAEIAEIEQDMEYLAATGLMPIRLERLLGLDDAALSAA